MAINYKVPSFRRRYMAAGIPAEFRCIAVVRVGSGADDFCQCFRKIVREGSYCTQHQKMIDAGRSVPTIKGAAS